MTYDDSTIQFQPIPSHLEDLTGQVFNRLTVLGYARQYKGYQWWCKCICGTILMRYDDQIKRGNQKSCGCLQTDVRKSPKSHGLSHLPEYRVWASMLDRCRNPNLRPFQYYGARGITVCERWTKFANFIEDMGCRPSKKHSIERRDNNGNYEPDNCYWATPEEQWRNKRNNIHITLNGVTKTAAEWAKELPLTARQIRARYHFGWSAERILTEPIRHW